MISIISALTALEKIAKILSINITDDLILLSQNPSLIKANSEAKAQLNILTYEWLQMLSRQSAKAIQSTIDKWVMRNTNHFEIQCVTAVALDKAQKARLESELQKKYPKNTVCYIINPDIYGGIQLIFPRYIVDHSLRLKLSRFMH